jgi:hypothetical protein
MASIRESLTRLWRGIQDKQLIHSIRSFACLVSTVGTKSDFQSK